MTILGHLALFLAIWFTVATGIGITLGLAVQANERKTRGGAR